MESKRVSQSRNGSGRRRLQLKTIVHVVRVRPQTAAYVADANAKTLRRQYTFNLSSQAEDTCKKRPTTSFSKSSARLHRKRTGADGERNDSTSRPFLPRMRRRPIHFFSSSQNSVAYTSERASTPSVHDNPYQRQSKCPIDPLLRFQRVVRTVQVLMRATVSSRREHQRTEAKLLSFTQLQDDLAGPKRLYDDAGLMFDPVLFKATRETQISHEAKAILSMDPKDRTDEQLHVALVSLNQAVEAFGEFPINLQKSLVRLGWYEHFEAKRVIIRQGHLADNFYFILSGTTVVTVLANDEKTGEPYSRTVAFLKKGNSFGELALMHGGKRSATVTCKDNVELLAVGREDFVDIFMHVEKDRVPEHIQYLRTVELLDGWPTDKLPWDDPKICLFTYFRRGVVMCRDSNKAEWVYIIKTGTCRVLKALYYTTPNIPGLEKQEYSLTPVSGSSTPRSNRSNGHKGKSRSPKSVGTSSSSLFGEIVIHDFPLTLPSPRKPVNNKISVQKGLPPIRKRNAEELRASEEQHKRQLDEIYNEKHSPLAFEKKQESQPLVAETDKSTKPNKVFVQIQKIGPKEAFGLVHVAFAMMGGCTSVSLVSDGAEAILINKKFFLQHLTDDMNKKLRQTIQPYPSDESLQQKLQDETNWEAYKSMTVNKHVTYQKQIHDTLLL